MPRPSIMPPEAMTGILDGIDDLRDERHGSHHRAVATAEEGAAVTAGFAALSDDRTDAGPLQRDRFFDGGGGAHQKQAARA